MKRRIHTGRESGSQSADRQFTQSGRAPQALTSVPDEQPPLIEIGKIVGAQGLKGEVRVYPDSDFPERFLQPGVRWLQQSDGNAPLPLQLLRGRYLNGKGLYVVQLEGITDRTQAEALQGCQLLASALERPPLEEDEFHVLDLIGLAVFDQATQALIGTVTAIVPAGNDLLAVQPVAPANPTGKVVEPLLIPFVKAIVPIVDLPNRRIEITPPAGLIP